MQALIIMFAIFSAAHLLQEEDLHLLNVQGQGHDHLEDGHLEEVRQDVLDHHLTVAIHHTEYIVQDLHQEDLMLKISPGNWREKKLGREEKKKEIQEDQDHGHLDDAQGPGLQREGQGHGVETDDEGHIQGQRIGNTKVLVIDIGDFKRKTLRKCVKTYGYLYCS